MEHREALAKALRALRKERGLTQEDFAEFSSRTYISLLERAQKSPTLDKVNELSQTMGIHPLTLLALSYHYAEPGLSLSGLFKKVENELQAVISSNSSPS